MTDWNARRNKSLSSVPQWLERAIEDYKMREGLQSWSAAILQLAAIAIQREYSEPETFIAFGDADFEKSLWQEYDELEFSDFAEFLKVKVLPPERGGNRKA